MNILTGTIIYLDPTDRCLTGLIGELNSEKGSFIFIFDSEDGLCVGQEVRFRINLKSRMAVLEPKHP